MGVQDQARRIRQRLRERDQRDAALPKAVCRVCGRWVQKGEGTRRPEPEFTGDPRARADHAYWLSTLPQDADGWRRTCPTCARAEDEKRAARMILAAVIGPHDLTESDANNVLHVLLDFDEERGFVGGVTAEATGRATGTPWAHVSEVDRDTLREAWASVVAKSLPGQSTMGACGMCGRAQASGTWYAAPDTLRWPDGSPTAFCASCAAVWHRRGEPSMLGDLHRVGVESATGWPVPLGDSPPSSFRLFAESRAADPEGLTDPWSWSDGLREYVEEVWTYNPRCAPADRRVEFEHRRRDLFARMAEEVRAEQVRQEEAVW